jgi:hypothetical protein
MIRNAYALEVDDDLAINATIISHANYARSHLEGMWNKDSTTICSFWKVVFLVGK